MKTVLSSLLFLLAGLTAAYGQTNSLDFSQFRLNGLKFFSGKDVIVKQLGKPTSVVEPNYECGFYSEREQGNKYYQLNYGSIKFIGNDQEQYAIETIDFNPDGKQVLEYGEWKLSGKTTTKEFAQIFGKSVLDNAKEDADKEIRLVIFAKEADNGVMFFFKSGRLTRIRHYTPC